MVLVAFGCAVATPSMNNVLVLVRVIVVIFVVVESGIVVRGSGMVVVWVTVVVAHGRL